MKRLFVPVILVLLPAVMVAQTTHLRFIQDGEFASVSEPTGPNSSFSVTVSRNTTNSGTTAAINYTAFNIAPDFSSLTLTDVIGAIPPVDFTGHNTQRLEVNFSTSDLDPTNSVSQTCTLNLVTFVFTCGAGPTGMINLQFRENSAQRTRVLALEEEITIGPLTTRIHQRSDNSSATVTGTVFGTAVTGGNATVGVNHSSTFEATRQ